MFAGFVLQQNNREINMKKIKLNHLRALIKEELRRHELSEGFLDFFWNRGRPESQTDSSKQSDHSSNEKETLYKKMYKVMSALTTIYARGRRQKEITDSSYFKDLLNSGLFKVQNQWELYKIIADASGEPDKNDPYYKFGEINIGKSRDITIPDPDLNKRATNLGKEILGRAGHYSRSFDELDNALRPKQTESLRRFVREIIKVL